MRKFEGSLRERVRCSSLVDWPVYPRLAHNYAGVKLRADAIRHRVKGVHSA